MHISTRGLAPAVNFAYTVLKGIAPDGGLYVPEKIFQFAEDDIRRLAGLSYTEVAKIVMDRFAPDMDKVALHGAIDKAYTPDVFANVTEKDDNPIDIVPVRHLGQDLYLARLSNGPTLAFKDLALQLLGHLFEIVLDGKPLNVLGATSGDTGSAAIHAMLGRKDIRVFMLSPHGRMSQFQSAQILGVNDPMIHNISVNGSFDDCQDVVKAVSGDASFREEYNIGAVNSINWARVAAQVVYYFFVCSRIRGRDGGQIDVAVPTGNYGNIYAAWVAKMMGLPIRRLILATNENDVLHEFFTTGIYRPRLKTIETSSPSMDITKASNFERYVFDVFGGNSTKVARLWAALDKTGQFDLSHRMAKIRETGITSCAVQQEQVAETINYAFVKYGIVIDPHTAVAMHSAINTQQSGVPMVVMETAQPCKFDLAIKQALGFTVSPPSSMKDLMSTKQFFTQMDPNVEATKEFIRARA
ncbi:MAG: threonine synthase [Parcubacteria group bacterium LiPW_30]|nr:MAG: threonine synthase [Parcubacteria group bacterium LiPW_30]